MLQCTTYICNNKVLNSSNNSQYGNNNSHQQDFSQLLFQFTDKLDNSSQKIVDFYDSFLLKKLDLAEQHIEQIAKLSKLKKPRKRIDNPTLKELDQQNIGKDQSNKLKKMKISSNSQNQKSQKKVFDDKFMNDLSKDLLQLDLDFMDEDNKTILQTSQKKQRQSNKNQLSNQKKNSSLKQSKELVVQINGVNILESITSSSKKKNNNSQPSNLDYQQEAVTNQFEMTQSRLSLKNIKEQKTGKQMVNENGNKKSNTLQVIKDVNGNKCRKSLIEQFSEIKVKPKEEIKNENFEISQKVEQINIEDFCSNTGNNTQFCQQQPERAKDSNHDQYKQEYLLLPCSSINNSDGQIQLNFNDNDEYIQANSMQPQMLPEGFYIHGNNDILLDEDEQENDYEMTDYSSNESSNLGSPIFNWVNKEEHLNDKLYLNNENYNNNTIFNIPSSKFNNKNQNIFETNSSQLSGSNENSKTYNPVNSDYFTQNTFGFGYNQPLFYDENSNSSQQNLKNISTFSQDSFQGINFNNYQSKGGQLQESSQLINQNMFISMSNNDSNSMNPYFYQNKQLLQSPQKLKTVKQRKILYCNNKEVPAWAQDLNQVTQKVREQKARGDDPAKLFGLFAVESLQLREVFKNTGKRYDEGRGSSANWRQDYTPDQVIDLINATSQTPNKKQKMQSKLKSFLQNSFNSIKKKLIQ
ncbi:hypothetical protein ABPG72_012928 [Tetrahymena utriculariae]